jgi:hypothetical protein
MDNDTLTSKENDRLLKLIIALKSSWSAATAYPGDVSKWTPEKPFTGQCAITSLILDDYFKKGVIHKNNTFNHYWYEYPKGNYIDLTKDQFNYEGDIKSDAIVNRKYLLKSEGAIKSNTKERYEALKTEIKVKLLKIKPTLLLVSSNAKQEYIQDILETLCLPNGTLHHFRYMLKYVDPLVRQILKLKEESMDKCLNKIGVVIVYLNQVRTENGYNWGKSMIVREGCLRNCYKTGLGDNSIAHFYFELGDNLITDSSYEEKIKKIYGTAYNKITSYAYLTYEDYSDLARKEYYCESFEKQCYRMEEVGLNYQRINNTTKYNPPLMLLIEGIYQQGWFKNNKLFNPKTWFQKSILINPKYDKYGLKSYYKLHESCAYLLKYRTFSWDHKKTGEIKIDVSKELFVTQANYSYKVNSAYNSESWELMPAFIKQNTFGYISISTNTLETNGENEIELNINVNLAFSLHRKRFIRAIDLFSDILFASGPIYIAIEKIYESLKPQPWWITDSIWILSCIYMSWFVLKLISKIIRGE